MLTEPCICALDYFKNFTHAIFNSDNNVVRSSVVLHLFTDEETGAQWN